MEDERQRSSLKRHKATTNIHKHSENPLKKINYKTLPELVPLNKNLLKLPRYRQLQLIRRSLKNKRTVYSQDKIKEICNKSFITGIQEMDEILLEQLTDRISPHNTDPEITIFESFLRNIQSLLKNILIFIRTGNQYCGQNQNIECTQADLIQLPATVNSNQGPTGNCGVMGFTGSLFSYLFTTFATDLDSSKISIISVLFTNENYLLFLFCITHDSFICKETIKGFFLFLSCYYKELLEKYGIDITYMTKSFILWFVIKYITEMTYSITEHEKRNNVPTYDLKNLDIQYFSKRGTTSSHFFSIFKLLTSGMSLIQILIHLQDSYNKRTRQDIFHHAHLITITTLEYLLQIVDVSSKSILDCLNKPIYVTLVSYQLNLKFVVGKALRDIVGLSFGFNTPEGWHEISNVEKRKLFPTQTSGEFDNDAFAIWMIQYIKDIITTYMLKGLYGSAGGSGSAIAKADEESRLIGVTKHLNINRGAKRSFHPNEFQGHAFGLYFYIDTDGNLCVIIINSWGCKIVTIYNKENIKDLIIQKILTEINLIIPNSLIPNLPSELSPRTPPPIVTQQPGLMGLISQNDEDDEDEDKDDEDEDKDDEDEDKDEDDKMGTAGGSNKKYSKKHNKKRIKTRKRKSKRRKTIKYNRK